MTTKVIVQPGRCVYHEGKRRFEGTEIHVGYEDLKAWTQSGDVAPAMASSQAASPGPEGLADTVVSLTPEQVYEAVTNMANGLQEAGLVVIQDAATSDAQADAAAVEGAEAVAARPAPKSKTKAAKA